MTSYSLTPFSRDGVEGVVVGPTPNAKYGKAATGEEEGVDAKVGGCVSEAGGEEAEGGRGFLASKPAPTQCLMYYFEIHVKDVDVKGQIAIGFTYETFKIQRQPGWETNSCGYHSDDGLLYCGYCMGEVFGQPIYLKT
ncbi:hypothetical protein GYH30_018714 [Glycine max]|nr:hypothetical protein GYH30_018714 [Glycine max]